MPSIECKELVRFTDNGRIAIKCGCADPANCPAKTKVQPSAQCFRVNLIGVKRERKAKPAAPVA